MQKIKNSGLALMGLAMLCMQATEALADCKPAVKAADKAAIASTYSAFQSLYGPYKSDLAATNAAQKAAIAKSNQYQAAKAKWIPVQKKCDAYNRAVTPSNITAGVQQMTTKSVLRSVIRQIA